MYLHFFVFMVIIKSSTKNLGYKNTKRSSSRARTVDHMGTYTYFYAFLVVFLHTTHRHTHCEISLLYAEHCTFPSFCLFLCLEPRKNLKTACMFVQSLKHVTGEINSNLSQYVKVTEEINLRIHELSDIPVIFVPFFC